MTQMTQMTMTVGIQHSFVNPDWKNLPQPTNKKGEPKTGKGTTRDSLERNHP
jgi:hypothetical protein